MPRHPRLFIPGATYHVYCCVARGEFVFDDDLEAQEFVETLREVRNLDTWTIYAWCLDGCRVDLGGCPPRPPTDPDVQNSRIRLLRRMDSLRDGRSSGRPWVVEAESAFADGQNAPRSGTVATGGSANSARVAGPSLDTH